VLDAIATADRVLLAPSNPFISLDPILAVDGVRAAVTARRDEVVAVAPIIAGRAVKGPLGELLDSLGHERSALGVARYLAPLAGTFLLDRQDALLAPAIEALGVRAVVADTLMQDPAVRAALARTALAA
jgi:LPPG:FO 2-phospho-L-lactate transferase